jgi:hypothetical protein
MVTLDNLPTDVLFLVFGALADIDLQSLFTARRACRAFQAVVTDILDNRLTNHAAALHTLFESRFAVVFDSSKASAGYEARVFGARNAPFNSLPWASDPDTRAKHLREEASWRQLPLISPSGHLIQRVQQVHQAIYWDMEDTLESFDGGSIGVWRMVTEDTGEPQFYFHKGLPLGLYYNEIISCICASGGGWRTLWDTRVKDPEEFFKLRVDKFNGQFHGRRFPNYVHVEEIPSLFVQDTNYIIMHCLGTSEDEPSRENIDYPWRPDTIGKYQAHLETFPDPPWH